MCVKKEDAVLLKDIYLEVGKGEILAILGPNGAGKSSLAYTIMGLQGYEVIRGSLEYDGCDLIQKDISERAKSGIALSWQEPTRFEGISVREFLELGGNKEYLSFLELFGIDESYLNRMVDHTLSGGERKRIELASVFSGGAKLLLLDEPDSGLDVGGVAYLKQAFKAAKEKDRSVLVITHQEEVASICDRVAILCDGRLEQVGIPEEVVKYFSKWCKGCEYDDR
jgi:Fe-S cluster assembly ATP-binding protein